MSARLKRSKEHGVVERRFYEQHPPRAEYVLTGKGGELRPMSRALSAWGKRHTWWMQRFRWKLTARVSYSVVGAQTANERSRGVPFAGEVICRLFTRKGMLTYRPSIVAASGKVLEGSATPDLQCTFVPGSFKGGQIGELEETPGLSAGAWQMRPLSRGYVEARSNRPDDAPAINLRYLSEEPDRR